MGGTHSGLMVSALDSRSNDPGLIPGCGHCVVFLGKTLSSHSVSRSPPKCINGYQQNNAGALNPVMD